MKLKSLVLSLAVAGAASVSMLPVASQAGVSANIGVVSDYVFRGTLQSNATGSTAVQGGVDYAAENGLFLGVWASSMDKGYEYDVYGGWSGTVGAVDLGAAYTAYFYSDDATYVTGSNPGYSEVNLSAGFGPVSFAVDFDVDSDITDYTHYAVSYDASSVMDGVSFTLGTTDTKGTSSNADYFSIAYGTSLDLGVDLSAEYIMSGKNNSNNNFFVIGLSKSFDLM